MVVVVVMVRCWWGGVDSCRCDGAMASGSWPAGAGEGAREILFIIRVGWCGRAAGPPTMTDDRMMMVPDGGTRPIQSPVVSGWCLGDDDDDDDDD